MKGRLLPILALLLVPGCVRVIGEPHVFSPPLKPSLDPAPKTVSWKAFEVPIGEDQALRGWHIVHPQARATLLFFYGNGEKLTRAHWRLFPWAERFRLNVICVDYRGFGYSDGRSSLALLREDALRIYDATARMRAGLPTLVMGYSMGSIPAIHAAAHRAVDGLALMAPISSADEVLPALRGRVPWYAKPFVRLELDEALRRGPQPVEEVRLVKAPLLVLHGQADPVVPPLCGQRVLDSAASASKALCAVPGAAHNDVYLWCDPGESAFRAWLDRVAPTSGG